MAVQRERLQAGLGVVVGDEAVEEAGACGGGQGVQHGPPVQRGDEAAGEGFQKPGAGVLLGDAVVALGGYVGFPNYLVGSNDLNAASDQLAEDFQAAGVYFRRFARNQSNED